MKYLKIKNKGLLDIRLVALMGGTTKSNDVYKIGQFGTGLKYTLAYLFRNNIDFKIFVGKEEIEITTEKEEIRGEIFEIICINGHRISITTKMGEEWQAWMIVRELWCNALDEGGEYQEVTETLTPEEDSTIFYIQINREIENVIKYWDKYFIQQKTPLYTIGLNKVYDGGNALRVYKNGVLIHEDTSQKALYAYDIANASINELREFKGLPNVDVVYALADAPKEFVTSLLDKLDSNGDTFEYNMDWAYYQNMGKGWKEAIGSAKLITKKTLQTLIDRGVKVDKASLIIVPKTLLDKLADTFENISATRVASKISDFFESYNAEVENRIKQGLVILEECGYYFHPEIEFTYGYFEDKTVQAQIDLKTKKIFISVGMLQKPLFTIVAMLIEENEHFNTGLCDETRGFQQHFIDLYTRQLLAKKQIEI